MTTYIGMALGGVFLTVLQLGFEPSQKPVESAFKIELRAMLKSCIAKNGTDCDVIERVINKSR